MGIVAGINATNNTEVDSSLINTVLRPGRISSGPSLTVSIVLETSSVELWAASSLVSLGVEQWRGSVERAVV